MAGKIRHDIHGAIAAGRGTAPGDGPVMRLGDSGRPLERLGGNTQ
jgi:hypothetical protein